jgi:hypothetical protein
MQGRLSDAATPPVPPQRKVIVDRFGMAQLVETIGKLKYPTIDLQAVQWKRSSASRHKRS